MLTTIYTELKAKNLNPYMPGKHQGICTVPYCVITDGGQLPSINTNRTGLKLVDVLVFVPVSSYPVIDSYTASVKAAMKELPDLRYTGNETSVIVDNDKEAYTKSITYQILKKLEG